MNPRWLILIPFALAGFALGYVGAPDANPPSIAMKSALSVPRTDATPSSPEEHRQRLDQKLRNEVAGGLVRSLVEKDSSRALEVARSLPEGRMRDSALVSIVEHFPFHGKRDEGFQLYCPSS